MSDYSFVLTLDDAEGCEPQIRMWIDDQLSTDLASEHEITLVRDGQTWSGNFSAGRTFIYRIGIVARPGARWSIAFRTQAGEAQELLFDSDDLTLAKEWLVGTCEDLEPVGRQFLSDASYGTGAFSS